MTPSCTAVRTDLGDLVDGDLPAEKERELERHLRTCPACREEKAVLLRTRSLLKGAGTLSAPRAWVLEAMRRSSERDLEAPAATRRRLPSRAWALPSMAAAAVLSAVMISLRLLGAGAAPPSSPAPLAPKPGALGNSISLPDSLVATPSAGAPPRRDAPEVGRGVATTEARPAGKGKKALDRMEDVNAANGPQPPPPLPVERIAFSQIHFQGAAGQTEPDAVIRKDREQGVLRAPPARRYPRPIRIRIRLDASSRVLSARGEEEPVDSETAALITRLPGATIEFPVSDSPVPERRSARGLLSIAREKALPPGESLPTREIIIEVQPPPLH